MNLDGNDVDGLVTLLRNAVVDIAEASGGVFVRPCSGRREVTAAIVVIGNMAERVPVTFNRIFYYGDALHAKCINTWHW